MAATGISKTIDLKREHINRITTMTEVQRYCDIYPEVEIGKYLVGL